MMLLAGVHAELRARDTRCARELPDKERFRMQNRADKHSQAVYDRR